MCKYLPNGPQHLQHFLFNWKLVLILGDLPEFPSFFPPPTSRFLPWPVCLLYMMGQDWGTLRSQSPPFTLGSTLCVMWFCEFWQMYHEVKVRWLESPLPSLPSLPWLLAIGLTAPSPSLEWLTEEWRLCRCSLSYLAVWSWGSLWVFYVALLVKKKILIFPKSGQVMPKMLQSLMCRFL